ncbi:hypothetical protein [Paenibacillus sp. NPDC057967]|uniref:hypothetical protein n=1 Tax=Paenibacillus sp. NPDC057967 TaxID=3346293 RepID=UPI0036DE3D05
MNNIQTDVILEFQKSIENMTRFGQEMETLDNRFGRLDERINAMRLSMSSLQSQVSRGTGTNLRQQLTNELNNPISGNGVVLQQLGTKGLTIKKETLQRVFGKVEDELNEELRKYVRNMNVDIDPKYAGGQRLPIGSEEFNEINKEVAKVVKLQIKNLVNTIERHKSNLIKPEALEGLQITIGKQTVMAFVHKLKNEILATLANPKIADASELNITKADMNKVIKEAKSKLLKALDVDLPELSNVDPSSSVKKIPIEIEQSLTQYVTSAVAGINDAMAGKMGTPVKDLSTKFKNILASELNTTVDKLDNLRTVNTGSDHGMELKVHLERVAQALDKKLSKSVQEEIEGIIKSMNDVEILPSPKLKRHIINEIDRINKALINKIREQMDIQVQSIIQEINQGQVRPKGLGNMGGSGLGSSGGGGYGSGGFGGSNNSGPTPTVTSESAKASESGSKNGEGMQGAILNTLRHVMSGNMVDAAMVMMYQAVETFKSVQTEQIKMTQNLMLKPQYLNDKNDPMSGTDFGKVDSVVQELQSFIRQQSHLYGTNYNKLYQVGSIGTQLMEDPLEIKKFIQLTAQLSAVDPKADPIKIANGLGSMKAQFGLELADMTEQVAQPLAAVSNMTNTSTELLMDSVKRMGTTANANGFDPLTTIVLAGITKQATALEAANIGNFYNSVINSSQSKTAVNGMETLGTRPYDDAKVANQMGSDAAKAKLQELNINMASNEATGTKMLQEVARALAGKDSATKRNTYDALFGTNQSSKGAATMHEILNTFVEVIEKTNDFDKQNYDSMIKKSLDNPLVNAKRAEESWAIGLDALVQELTPTINKVSQALMNMGNFVERNAYQLQQFAGVFSHILIGMLMMRGVKWGAGKLKEGIAPNFQAEKERSEYLRKVKDFTSEAKLVKMSRKDLATYQQDPLLGSNVREMSAMGDERRSHLKNYLTDNKLVVKDMATLFTAMDESKGWVKKEELNPSEKFDRTKQYFNRLSTRPDLASVFNPSFLTTMNHSTVNGATYASHRTTSVDYANMSDRLSGMTQGEFRGFEDSLIQRQRNGLPAIDDIGKLSSALDDYDREQRTAIESARQANPTFGNLSNAVRHMNDEIARTASLKNGFKQFLKDIPDMGRGALSSIKNLAGGIAKLALEIASAVGAAEVGKSLTESFTLTANQRQLASVEAQENGLNELAQMFRMIGEGKEEAGQARRLYGGSMNAIRKQFGLDPSYYGGEQWDEDSDDMVRYFMRKHGISSMTNGELGKFLKENNIDPEEAVREWAEASGKTKKIEGQKQDAINKQYAEAQMKEVEERTLSEIAAENFNKKYKEGELRYPAFDATQIKQRIETNLGEVKDKNSIQTLNALMSGMKTDSDEYIKMRQEQVKNLRGVLNEELGIIDKYILNAKAIMENADPDSQEYKNAEQNVKALTSTREKIQKDLDEQIMQEEFNGIQEAYRSKVNAINNKLQQVELLVQAKELAAAYNMDTESQAYYDAMKSITQGRISQMKAELQNLKEIEALGDLSTGQAVQIQQLQNSIASEQAKIKEYNLASIGIGRSKIDENKSIRENELLALKLSTGNPDDSTAIMRNKRIANAKAEVSDINTELAKLRARTPVTEDEAKKIQQEIRDLQKQSLQAQLGILDEMKATAGTFNMPDGVRAMSRYEYLTRGNTHNMTTIGNGDVTVNITLPNVTNGMTASQLQQVGQSIGQGLSVGRVGGLRKQQAMNPHNYRS